MPKAAVQVVPLDRVVRRSIWKQINQAIHQLQLADEEVDNSNPARAAVHFKDASDAINKAVSLLPKGVIRTR